MKRFYIFLLTAIMIISCSLCAYGAEESPDAGEADGLTIVATIFPEYDWVRNILGDNPGNVQVSMLYDNGADPHNYHPAVDDILLLSGCDLFICVGGESDQWTEDVLADAANPDMVVVRLLESLGSRAREEEHVPGPEGEEEHDHEELEYDEHIWLSLQNASVLVDVITEALAGMDPANADLYRSNAAAYTDRLGQLDAMYREAVSEADVRVLLFGDRFPFRYLTEDYGLTYYAAFDGCSAETEASFETIVFLTDRINELSLASIIVIEGSDHKLAETVRNNTETKDQKILTMDSLQSVTQEEVAEGVTYLSVMEQNLQVLKEALQ